MTDPIYKLNKTQNDIEQLLCQHKNLVYYMLTKMHQLNNQDAESAAWEALWDAICTFDVFAKNSFSTYACTVIRNAINNALRKQQLEENHICTVIKLSEQNNLVSYMEPDNAELVAFIEREFNYFVKFKKGIARNVLLVWFATAFAANVTQIALKCGCSPSYVTRVQNDFRAYLSGKLKDF